MGGYIWTYGGFASAPSGFSRVNWTSCTFRISMKCFGMAITSCMPYIVTIAVVLLFLAHVHLLCLAAVCPLGLLLLLDTSTAATVEIIFVVFHIVEWFVSSSM